MFDFLVNLFTASAMLVHSIFGCCSHHAHVCEHGHEAEKCQHADDRSSNAESAEKNEATHSCGHHHHHSATSDTADATEEVTKSDESSEQCPHEPCDHSCDGDQCVFASQFDKVEPPASDQVSLVDLVSIQSACLATSGGQYTAKRHAEAEPTGMLTACRCRLITQTWLL